MSEVSYEPLIRDMTWSYSRLKAFEDCPYRWYLKYILFPRAPTKELFFSSFGSFIHDLLADFYSGEKTVDDIELEYLRDFRRRVPANAPSGKVFQSYFMGGLDGIRSRAPPRNKVLSVENKSEFYFGGAKMQGFIDRLEETPDGELVIVDNKSRALKPRSQRKKPTKADAELDSYLRQLYVYSASVEQEFGRLPSLLCYDCFRTQNFISEPFSPTAYEEARQWVNP